MSDIPTDGVVVGQAITVMFDGTVERQRIYQFAKDLSREFTKNGLGSLPIMTAINVVDRVRVTDIKAKKMRRAVAAVEEVLTLNELLESSSLSLQNGGTTL